MQREPESAIAAHAVCPFPPSTVTVPLSNNLLAFIVMSYCTSGWRSNMHTAKTTPFPFLKTTALTTGIASQEMSGQGARWHSR